MNAREFEKRVQNFLTPVLEARGFSTEKSSHAIFYRKTSEDIYHFLGADFRNRGQWFDIKVFSTSPRIDPQFVDRFPDALAIPSDVYCYLNGYTGVGSEQQAFKVGTAAQLEEMLESKIKPLILDKGLPYLDRIVSLRDLVPLIRNKLFLGLALNEIGEFGAAQAILVEERARLEKVKRLNPENQDVKVMLGRLHLVLKSVSV